MAQPSVKKQRIRVLLSNKILKPSGNQEMKNPGCLFIYSDRGRKERMKIEKNIPEAALDFHRNIAVLFIGKTAKRKAKEKQKKRGAKVEISHNREAERGKKHCGGTSRYRAKNRVSAGKRLSGVLVRGAFGGTGKCRYISGRMEKMGV